MTRKISLTLSLIASIILFALSLKAQSAADIGLENTLETASAMAKEEAPVREEAKVLPSTTVENSKVQSAQSTTLTREATTRTTLKQEKKQARIEKLLNSKFGQWIVKKATLKAHKKQVRKELKTFEGDKAAKKAYKENAKKQALEIKSMNSNVRTGIILIAVGIILTILPSDILRTVGAIVIVIGLVFLILGLI